MANAFAKWFRVVWPGQGARKVLLAQYATLSEKELVLADIAMRGSVWRTTHDFSDARTAAFNEGRRALALEILELAGMDPMKLRRLVEETLLTSDRTGS